MQTGMVQSEVSALWFQTPTLAGCLEKGESQEKLENLHTLTAAGHQFLHWPLGGSRPSP